MNATIAIPSHTPTTASEVQELVHTLPKLIPHGAKTKATLLAVDAARVDMTGITGITEYDPGEYTFTAYAGIRLAEIAAALAEHGQYMPFDPPFIAAGATLGGTIAAGLSGSGRYRYGGLRDFILGVNIVDGQGRFIRGGGKVVKNAAGFDLPKLMVGSQGRLGILISASFKVFPAPFATATLQATLPSLPAALDALARLMSGPYDLEALDLLPDVQASTVTLLARLGGPVDVLNARLDRLRILIGNGESVMDDDALWATAREFTWADDSNFLIKVATTQQTIAPLDRALQTAQAQRRYAVGGNLTWIAWPHALDELHQLLVEQNCHGLLLRGNAPCALIGTPLASPFLTRVRTALDPNHRFVEFE
jgi:glycolate oxidase FAD binding subunit